MLRGSQYKPINWNLRDSSLKSHFIELVRQRGSMGDKCVGAEGNGSEGEQTLLATFLDGGGGEGFGLHLTHWLGSCFWSLS